VRNARLQSKDLQRTERFFDDLLSPEDIKNQEKPEVAEPARNHVVNGNALSFRSDGGKTRFSDPPAPPPSQPLPEKPDVSKTDVPSLKRGITERPKLNAVNTSPIRQDNAGQNSQLMEMLASARKEADTHSARVRDLEEMLLKEREARLYAEDVIQKLEETNQLKMNGASILPLVNGNSELDKAFDPPVERPLTPEPSIGSEDLERSPPKAVEFETSPVMFEARIEAMLIEMKGLREQVEAFKQRAEQAEAERDVDRKSLAELVMEISRRNEEEKLRATERKSRSRSKTGSRPGSRGIVISGTPASADDSVVAESPQQSDGPNEEATEAPILSRTNTITPATEALAKAPQDAVLITSLPYASMISVVLIGMGLMAYLNGWQPQPRLER
jgi:hypothetical protein